MKNAILITHGPIGSAIIEAVRGIMGVDEGLYALSVTDMSLNEISARLAALVNAPENQDDGIIVMASLKGGSCWNVSAAVAGKNPNVRVVSGVNLPMALSFITKRDSLSLDDLVETLETDGQRGVVKFEINQTF
ncbi:MAG: hypothetical protein GWP06_06750 [Actinobacteria bacterium]|nr:hypothetical protein [Actinomycetota bacterium]